MQDSSDTSLSGSAHDADWHSSIPAEVKAGIVVEALPYMQRYDSQVIVVKFGGHAMGDEESVRRFGRDVTLLRQAGARPVVVHGGGPQIGRMLAQLGVESKFSGGLRVTDARTMEVAEMVLCGNINNQIVNAIQICGGRAVGCSGKDGGMVYARRMTRPRQAFSNSNVEDVADLGFVGEPEKVSDDLLVSLIDGGFIPVIAPVAVDTKGQSLNVNADTIAGSIAGVLGAKRLLMLSDVSGIADGNGVHVPVLTETETKHMIDEGIIHGGMIPKVETGFSALRDGVDGVVVLDGRLPHSILIELFTQDGCGTLLKL